MTFGCLFTRAAYSQISPGKLARPHSGLEGIQNCTQCHTLGGGPDSQKCLQCHSEIKQTIDLKKGYHFFATQRKNEACFVCHSEHNGRDFQIIFWQNGKENFDHNQTGFPLQGKHKLEATCKDCHQPKNIANDPRKLNKKVDITKTFLGLSQDCLSCHEDEHRGQLPKQCLQCHNFAGWKPAAKFDHKRAKFRLTGKHENVACAKCHPSVTQRNGSPTSAQPFTKYVGLAFENCSSCHRDVHSGKFGQNCQKCHGTSGWQQIDSGTFDHSLTRFPLRGSHASVDCAKCHGSRKKKTKIPFANCTDCHKDVHQGQFADRTDGGRCESCHTVSGFVPATFDVVQHKQTDYPLTGSHLAVPCLACHRIVNKGKRQQHRVFDFADVTCKGCHQDVHKGQFAVRVQAQGCESCHQTLGWQQTLFDHNLARFPLRGKHVEIPCQACHKTIDAGTKMARTLFKPMQMTCKSCHEDIHLGQFRLGRNAKTCDKCHSPAGWTDLLFDHNRDSLFRLKKAHQSVPCEDCHKVRRKGAIEFVLFKPMDRKCESCHG